MTRITNNKYLLILLLIYGLMPAPSYSKTLNIVVGFTRPPYVIQETNSGYELELISQVTKLMGYDVDYIYVPYGRASQLLSNPDIDAVTTMTQEYTSTKELLTDVYVTYHNTVVSMANSHVTIAKINDLKDISLIGFQNAQNLLGPEFHEVVSNNPNYLELSQQLSQVEMLFKGRVHSIVIDKNIFSYISRQLGKNQSVDFHDFFSPTQYKMAFKKPSLVKSFNKHLALFKSSDEYIRLQKAYLAAP